MTNLFKLSLTAFVFIFLAGCGIFERVYQGKQPNDFTNNKSRRDTQNAEQRVVDFMSDFPLYELDENNMHYFQYVDINYYPVSQTAASEYKANIEGRNFNNQEFLVVNN